MSRRGLIGLLYARSVWQQAAIRSVLGTSSYYLCPRCSIPLEREFVPYCDQCGQKLSWKAVCAQWAEKERD